MEDKAEVPEGGSTYRSACHVQEAVPLKTPNHLGGADREAQGLAEAVHATQKGLESSTRPVKQNKIISIHLHDNII